MTPQEQQQLLIDELRKAEYQGLSDREAASAMWDKSVWVRVWVDTADVITHASSEGYYATMQDAADQPPSGLGEHESQCRKHAKNILKFVESVKTKEIDMDSQAAVNMKYAMGGCGFATPEQVASLDALANKQVRWLDHVGIGKVGDGTIRSLRGML